MAYKLRSRAAKIRALDSFLADYRRICKKHGVMLEQGVDHDGRAFLTIACWDGKGALDLDLDEARDVPCVDQALEKLADLKRREQAAKDRDFHRAAKSTPPGDPLQLLEAALPYLHGYKDIEELRLKIAATVRKSRGRNSRS